MQTCRPFLKFWYLAEDHRGHGGIVAAKCADHSVAGRTSKCSRPSHFKAELAAIEEHTRVLHAVAVAGAPPVGLGPKAPASWIRG
jgi:hypothetical protein